MKTQFGRDFTAQPYGVNTVGGFPFLFNVMLPVAKGGGIEKAWKAGCTGNFIVGCPSGTQTRGLVQSAC